MEISQEGLDKLQQTLGLEDGDFVFDYNSNNYYLSIRVVSLKDGWAGILTIRAESEEALKATLMPAAWCLPGTERPPHPYPDSEEVLAKFRRRLLANPAFLEHVSLNRSA